MFENIQKTTQHQRVSIEIRVDVVWRKKVACWGSFVPFSGGWPILGLCLVLAHEIPQKNGPIAKFFPQIKLAKMKV